MDKTLNLQWFIDKYKNHDLILINVQRYLLENDLAVDNMLELVNFVRLDFIKRYENCGYATVPEYMYDDKLFGIEPNKS
jgi:hypothetical protein